MRLLMALMIVLLASSCTSHVEKNSARSAIESAMDEQQEAWNSGDINGFMEAYWKSDSLVFIGSRGLTYGWNTVLSNYQKSYPDQAAMGKLTFNNRLFRVLDEQHSWVAGQWTLHRKSDTLSGHYTLVWKNINGEWRIISDHSS